MSNIPKVIHYCWFGPNPLPDIFEKCFESWKKYCPEYEIKFWNEDNFDFGENEYLKKAKKFNSYSKLSNLARWIIIYLNGGVYLDIDVELIKPLDELLNYEGFLGFEATNKINTGLGFGFVKGHQLLEKLISEYQREAELINSKDDFKVCHEMDTPVFVENGLKLNNKLQIINKVAFLTTEYLCPRGFYDYKINFTNNTFSIHHFTISYSKESSKYNKLLNKRIIMSKYLGVKLEKIFFNISLYGKQLIKTFFSLGPKSTFTLVLSKTKKFIFRRNNHG
jgi:hypothetical protein